MNKPSLQGALLMFLVVFTIIGFGFITERQTGMSSVTGNVVGVTGMDVANSPAATIPTWADAEVGGKVGSIEIISIGPPPTYANMPDGWPGRYIEFKNGDYMYARNSEPIYLERNGKIVLNTVISNVGATFNEDSKYVPPAASTKAALFISPAAGSNIQSSGPTNGAPPQQNQLISGNVRTITLANAQNPTTTAAKYFVFINGEGQAVLRAGNDATAARGTENNKLSSDYISTEISKAQYDTIHQKQTVKIDTTNVNNPIISYEETLSHLKVIYNMEKSGTITPNYSPIAQGSAAVAGGIVTTPQESTPLTIGGKTITDKIVQTISGNSNARLDSMNPAAINQIYAIMSDENRFKQGGNNNFILDGQVYINNEPKGTIPQDAVADFPIGSVTKYESGVYLLNNKERIKKKGKSLEFYKESATNPYKTITSEIIRGPNGISQRVTLTTEDGKTEIKIDGNTVASNVPPEAAKQVPSRLREGYVIIPGETDENQIKFEKIEDSGERVTETTLTIHKDGRENKEKRVNGVLKSRESKTTDGHTLLINYGREGESNPSGATFTTSDGRKTTIARSEIITAVSSGQIDVNDLYLAREIDEGAAFFGRWRDQTDANWNYNNKILTIGTITINLAANQGVRGNTAYELTPGGYTYYTGGDVVVNKETGTFTKGTDASKYRTIREFTTDHEEYGIKFRKGDYISTDSDGGLIYQYGKLNGAIVDGKAVLLKDMFDDQGKLKGEYDTNNPAVKFIKEKYTTWSLASFGIRLQSAYRAAQGGRALSNLLMNDNAWRKGMDNFFANTIFGQAISGRWEDSICHVALPEDAGGVLNFNLPGNIVGVGAHVGAEITTTTFPNGTQIHLYKITYGVNNPKFEEPGKSRQLSYNIFLYGQRTIKVFKQDRDISEGEIIRGTGTSPDAIPPQYSDFLYNKVCLKFSEPVETARGGYKYEVCNTITTYQGPATSYTGTTTTVSGTTPGGEGEFNDF